MAQVQLPDNSFSKLYCFVEKKFLKKLNLNFYSIALAYPFAKCPNGCSFFRNQCTNGVCQCDVRVIFIILFLKFKINSFFLQKLGSGVDCSLLECPEDW